MPKRFWDWFAGGARRAAVALLASGLAAAVQAAAPQLKTSGPGYYRMMLGDFEITALNDGTVDLHAGQLLTNTTAERVRRALARAYLKDPVETSVNAYLINTGAKLVLIDAGAASLFGPTLGRLLANLKASGYQPEQVDEIYLTHLHPDHVGGLMDGDKPAFPYAVVRADQHEADYWLNAGLMDLAPEAAKGFFKGAMVSVNPYIAAGRFRPFDGETEMLPGIRAVPARGHTPGHTIYVVESRGERFVAMGDLLHVGAVQFAAPGVTIRFDVDPKAAAPARRKAFADAARRGHYVGLTHVAFPGIGRLRADGKGYDWIPANFTVLR